MRRKVFVVIAAMALAGCGHSSAVAAPVVASSPSVLPTPRAYGIPRPYADCVTDAAGAGLGWTIYGWDSGKQLAQEWYPDVERDVRVFAGTELELTVAWYCPPR